MPRGQKRDGSGSTTPPPDRSPVSWTGKKFAGDEFLTDWILQYQPDIVLSGHIHNAPFYPDGSWIARVGKTWVFNPGRQLGPSPTHLSLDLTQMTATWLSTEGAELRRLALPDASDLTVPSDVVAGS